MNHRIDPTTAALAELAPFRGLSPRELRRLHGSLTAHRIPAGTVVMDEGRPGREVMVIASGRAVVTKAGQPIAELGRGDICGEMAVIDLAARTASVVAATDLDVYVMSVWEFRTVLAEHPTVQRSILGTLAARLRQADRELVA